MKFVRSAALAAAALSAFAATPALALDFTFSFSSDTSDVQVTNEVPGTVYGRILGLTDNATSSAASVIIDGYTVGGFGGTPTDAVLWNEQQSNSFTVSGGVITAATFWADQTSGSYDRFFLNVALGYVNGNTSYASTGVSNSISIWNNNGLKGVTFAPLSGAVPEPATWAMMIGGFALVGASMRRRSTAVSFA